MKTEWQFRRTSTVEAMPHEVWHRVTTPAGINDEMRPWMTMSTPRGAEDATIDSLEIGVPVGRAWLRLFGIVPFDYDLLVVAEVEPGRRFREESSMASMRRWSHDRTVDSAELGGSIVTDVVTFAPRLPLRLAGPVLVRCLALFFGHRHRRLARHFATSR